MFAVVEFVADGLLCWDGVCMQIQRNGSWEIQPNGSPVCFGGGLSSDCCYGLGFESHALASWKD